MGLPLLHDKEVAAIAAEVTRRITVRKVFEGQQSAVKVLNYIVQEADRLMAAAKVDEYINDDAIDQILDIKSSYDRKVYGQRFNMLD
jgi:transposase-like protein